MLKPIQSTVTDAPEAEVVSTLLHLQAQLTGYVHMTVRLAPGTSANDFAEWHSLGKIVYRDIRLEEDQIGEITLNDKVIGSYEVGDHQYDVGPYDGEPVGERMFLIKELTI